MTGKQGTTTGCGDAGEYTFFVAHAWYYLTHPGLFVETHHRYAAYANSWDISPEQLLVSLPPNSYQKNADGSIDVSLMLVFRPQSWLILGILISGATLLIACIILGVTRFRRRQ